MKLTQFEKIKVGDRVAVTTAPDATWFEVVALERPGLILREGPENSTQYLDICYVRQHISKEGA